MDIQKEFGIGYLIVEHPHVSGGSKFFMPAKGRLTVGRGLTNDIAIPDDIVLARCHALFTPVDSTVFVFDIGNPMGVFVNGKRVDGRLALKDNDIITMGQQTRLVYHVVSR